MNTKIRTLAALTAGTVVTVTMLSGPAFAAGEPTESTFSSAEIGAIKAASDPDPFTAKEIDEARAESATKDKRLGIAGGVGTLDVPPPPPASSYLADNHVAQAYSNYCGPATARMTLLHQGKNCSQATLAGRFGITPNNGGTSWDAMLSALKNLSGVGYAGEFLAYSPSAADKASYKSRLQVDISHYRGSIAGNVWEVPNGPHLTGHPNKEIFHWVNIRGYKESGRYSQVQDPATSVWSGVPANSPVDSDKLVVMMGGRGYQW
ncbi:C39 family peptidase [Streptomyces hydrogenans]|uniref:C39 family peptidase n=1 Tax=Streptomyces hydrogenans TaxID=1873719 RepID=UPI0035D73188